LTPPGGGQLPDRITPMAAPAPTARYAPGCPKPGRYNLDGNGKFTAQDNAFLCLLKLCFFCVLVVHAAAAN
jgi:hypothetical protein